VNAVTTEQFITNLGLEDRTWSPKEGLAAGFSDPVYGFTMHTDEHGIEVLAVASTKGPKKSAVQDLWRARQGGQALPLLLVCLPDGDENALIVGPASTDLTVRALPRGVVTELLRAALAERSISGQSRYLTQRLSTTGEEPFMGLRNRNLFADHALAVRARARDDWTAAEAAAEALTTLEGDALVKALGFKIEEPTESGTLSLLRTEKGGARAIAVFLDQGEHYNEPAGRFTNATPLAAAFGRARSDNLPFVIITRGSEIRLYQVADRAGVGRKDATETYVEANVRLLSENEKGFLPLVFSAKALVDGGSFDQILEESRNYSADLSASLRERVYIEVVPALAVAVANANDGVEDADLNLLYEQAMLVLFRLLFVAYAEDRDLLPYRTNSAYHDNSIKALARELSERHADSIGFDGDDATDLWTRVGSVWEAVDVGNPGWGVPAYNGGLFAADASDASKALAGVTLTNEAFGPALSALLVERSDPPGPVDFRTLSVRDFGTVYEGLLESSISLAPDDLTVDRQGNYVPVGEDQEPLVRAGEIYHHNRSGARKSSGSYFTKEFAVEHLLDHALEPALDAHFERLADLIEKDDRDGAAEALFDFRCADIAMGSGHFLVAATDRIELRMAAFLEGHDLPAVDAELERLRLAATNELGDAAEHYEIDDRMLLRRLIARRCVYGSDINRIAVELARLALWVHTFVPGLPLSFLDHNLVCGDALTGIGTVEEAADYLTEQSGDTSGQISIFDEPIRKWLHEASEPLLRLARATDTSRAELAEVRAAQKEALDRVGPVSDLFDLVCALRRGDIEGGLDGVLSTEAVAAHYGLPTAKATSAKLNSLHFPVAFPEVFMRPRPGFDCLLGNPPWEKIKVEKHGFWATRFPGLRGQPVSEMNRMIRELEVAHPSILSDYDDEVALSSDMRKSFSGRAFPDMGTGDPDLFKAFAWRFFSLARRNGMVGVVMPRAIIGSSGGAAWRSAILEYGEFVDVTTLVNRGGWVFSDVHQQYTIALVSIRKGLPESPAVAFIGPFADLGAFRDGQGGSVVAEVSEFRGWSNGSAFPLIPSVRSGEVFRKMRESPRLDAGAFGATFRGVAEMHGTADKAQFILDSDDSSGLWPVYGGKSFNIWSPDTGRYNMWADPASILEVLNQKRGRQARLTSSAFYGLPVAIEGDLSTLPCLSPRVAFRRTARATDSRTLIPCLVPGNVVLAEQAPYLLMTNGDTAAEAALLGVLCGLVADWYARRFVETSLSFDLLNAFPVPSPAPELRDRLARVAGRLASPDDRFAAWAADAGVVCGPLAKDEKDSLVAELDALVTTAYGLDRDDLIHIFETFHEGWDYAERLERTLTQFDAL
jgi:hypothetical protein